MLAALFPIELACHSPACAPPPVGTGGSLPGPITRAAKAVSEHAVPRNSSIPAKGRDARILKAKLEAAINDPDGGLSTTNAAKRARQLDRINHDAADSDLSTMRQHNHRGADGKGWSRERAEYHAELLNEIEQTAIEAGIPADRDAFFLGGMPGSGKSSSLAPGGKAEGMKVVAWEPGRPVPEGATHVSINADLFKERLIRDGKYTAIKGLHPMEHSSFLHEESSYLSKALRDRLAARGINVVIDGTMGPGSSERHAAALSAYGYKDFGVLYTVNSVAESLRSVQERYRRGFEARLEGKGLGGRHVPNIVSRVATTKSGRSSRNEDYFWDLAERGFFRRGLIVDNTGIARGKPKGEVLARIIDGKVVRT